MSIPCRIFDIDIISVRFKLGICIGPICEAELICAQDFSFAKYRVLDWSDSGANLNNLFGLFWYISNQHKAIL